ncbi:MAG: S41 family peptidase, partial [Clostridia bacterium]|nr:S41 family peptidase [Clostridia bacterium]
VFVQNEGKFPLTQEQKIGDFEYLYDTLKESYPYFEVKKRQLGFDWLAHKQEFIDEIKMTRSDREYYMVLNQILMRLQNGHTNIIAPGSEYEEYQRLYDGPQPWSQVYHNARVKSCYKYWETIIPDGEPPMIPVVFKYIEGNYYASKNLMKPGRKTDELGIPMGAQLLKVDGVPVDDYIKALNKERILKTDTVRHKAKMTQLVIRTSKAVDLTFQTLSGEQGTKCLKPLHLKSMGGPNQNEPEHLFTTELLEPGSIAYLKLPSLASFYVEKDRAGLRAFLESIKDYKGLIIDIRGNGGGSTEYWMDDIIPLLTDKTLSAKNYILFKKSDYIKPFMKQKMFFDYYALKPLKELAFSKDAPGYYLENDNGVYEELSYEVKPNNPVGFKGRIYLLVDDYVYSSAEALAVFAKATHWATLVGTRTGGDGIGFDPVPVALPNSGLVVRFPSDMGLNPDGTVNEETATQPDVYVEQSYEDFVKRIEAEKASTPKQSVKESLPYDTVLRTAVELAQKP